MTASNVPFGFEHSQRVHAGMRLQHIMPEIDQHVRRVHADQHVVIDQQYPERAALARLATASIGSADARLPLRARVAAKA